MDRGGGDGPSILAKMGLGALTVISAVAVYRSWGFGFLTLNSGLAIYRANGDLASILFVAGSYITLLLLFRCLHDYERAPPGSPARQRARRAVWLLTTTLGRRHMERRLALAMAALGVLACNSALAIHKDRGGAGSLAFLLVAFASLVVSISLFLAKFDDHVNGVEQSQVQLGRGLAADDAAHGDVCVEGGAADARGTDRRLALAMVAFGVLACNSALAVHKARGDAGSVAFVLIAFAALVVSISLFLAKLDDGSRC
ncbi:hypothetical protein BAE44_0000596 [Dichanthelium oligosanthes]|uniref:Uncharacterized protein n=1 Tax=Dichanthelium oligosanthes TaxID=888268 RepID=A0A1E5WLV4_9POAL|nr:hypothetical protein BAE44_0000596 [Dichanthelium oligosanthes]